MAILLAACSFPLAAQNYTFEPIECNNFSVHAYGMNGAGVVVGTAGNGGVIYYNGRCQTYPSLFFYGVSDTGSLIAYPANSPNNTFYLVEPGGKAAPLPNYPGLQKNFSYCCMDTLTGTLAGNYTPPGAPINTLSGFFYQNGKFTSLPWSDASGSPSYQYTIAALNNTGTAVGTFSRNYVQGFVYQKSKMTILAFPGATYTYFQGVNDKGVVVGNYNTKSSGVSNIFLYDIQTATWTDLNFPYPYDNMNPVGISNTGVIALGGPTGGLVLATPTGN
jgi:hypothetical protein